MFSFQFNVVGEIQFDRAFSRFGDSLEDFRGVWADLRDSFYRKSNKLFVSGGSSGGQGQWRTLTPKYAKWKAKKFGGKGILEATGKLKKSLTRGNAEGSVAILEPQEFQVGTSLEYAKYHQFGTARMARRAPVSLSESDRRDWTKIVQRALLREFRNQKALAMNQSDPAENNSN